ncbi:MAG: phosphate ABC transporter substrate-binding protein [Clostridiales bacterium]|nr:phosphate ABC transporter substrate-binding protein [Clostridiales bacterium]MCF8021826.1 phosphate ABC transporter substrate-binding protein [Clostridiales bacterium]
MFRPLSKLALVFAVVFLLAGLVAGCGGNSDSGQEQSADQNDGKEELSGTLQVNGSTTVTPVAQAWAEKFHQKHSGVEVVVSGTGSGNGIAALINGTTDIAMASRKMKEKEEAKFDGTPKCHVVGRDGVAIVVHPGNSVESLTMEEAKAVFTGEVTNWKEVGGADQEITVYTRDTSSGTYGFVKEKVLEDENFAKAARKTASNASMAKTIAQEESSIGYCGLAFVDDSLKAVSISADGADPVKPSFETAASGDYPVVRDLNMYTIGEAEGLAKAFFDYGFSEEGQAIVKEIGYLPVK